MNRQISEIRSGTKHGPVSSYVNAANIADLNPFVLWDHFYIPQVEGVAGFGFHGHSGVATISYPQIGDIEHEDTSGHDGFLQAGGVQIMSAGAGVLHKETVHSNNKVADAFQLWIALPVKGQELGPVTYSTVQQGELPIIKELGATTKVIVGHYKNKKSPAQAPVDMTYLHTNLKANSHWVYSIEQSQTTAFIYVRHGAVIIENIQISEGELAIFEKGVEPIVVKTAQQDAEFLIISGAPLNQAIISNGSSVHSNTENLIAGVRRIKQIQTQQKNT